ncbi:amidohydrolase family protein [Ensifer soli]|uniref:amidohydrolase family protein n=1 Tax=Ciceribacter sp. sgz301302 TaxID=3342379 RepID=UPI0035B7C922
MIIDFSSKPPLPQFMKTGAHLSNYRRVYEKSEQLTAPLSPEDDLAAYLAMYDRLDAQAVVIKARDLETTFGFAITNDDVAAFCRQHGSRYIGFAGVDPHKGAAAVTELRRAVLDLGLRGLNVQGFEHRLKACDRLLYPLYEVCLELDIPVNIHCGINFSQATPMSFGRPEHIDQVLVDFPGLRVCASPPGWPWIDELIGVAWRHPTLWIGLVAVRPKLLTIPHSGYGGLLQYGARLMADRILFGSSYPMTPVERSVDEIRTLPLADAVKRKWLHDNAAAFLGLTPQG